MKKENKMGHGTMVEKDEPEPFPGDIPDHPLRPWDDDPDEEKYKVETNHKYNHE